MTERKVSNLSAFITREALGSVSQVQLRNNLTQIGLHQKIIEVICDRYKGTKVKIVTSIVQQNQ
jgi:hypothetical protein